MLLNRFSAVTHGQSPVHMVSRLRLDAALYEPAPPRQPHQIGHPRLKGRRLPTLTTILSEPSTPWQSVVIEHWYGQTNRSLNITTGTAVWYHTSKPPVPIRWVLLRDPKGHFDPQAFLCIDLRATPTQTLTWFRQRWQVEVTFEEVRAHLGVETQRQWSDLAIERSTPALFGLFSLVTLWAHYRQTQQPIVLLQTAWYRKSRPTFVDVLATVRRALWDAQLFEGSLTHPNIEKVPSELLHLWSKLLCYAA